VAGQRARALAEMGAFIGGGDRADAAARGGLAAQGSGGLRRGAGALPDLPDDIVGWLRDHYREHVEQSADLIAEWQASR